VSAQGAFHPLYPSPSMTDPQSIRGLTEADGGTITIYAGTLSVRGSRTGITTDSRNFGRSGDIIIRAGDIFLSDGGRVAAESMLAGNSGNITVHATGSINLNNGEIRAITAGSGDGGTVNVTAGQSIIISGSGSDISSSTRPASQG